jgi:hypothetical protein
MPNRLETPDNSMTGETYLHSSIGVYAWKKNGVYIYVGSSIRIFARIANHNIINKAERVEDSDTLDFWYTETIEDAKELESIFISSFKPRLNQIIERYISEEELYNDIQNGFRKAYLPPFRICLICKKEFVPKRAWQKYCSKECRDGAIVMPEEKRCYICNTPVVRQGKQKRYFCSDECRNEYKANRIDKGLKIWKEEGREG